MTDIEKSTTMDLNEKSECQNENQDNGEVTSKPTVVFKRQNKNRNIRKRDLNTTILEDSTPNIIDEKDNSENSSTSKQDDKEQKKQKVNEYTTKTDKKSDFSFESTGSAKPMFSEADTSSMLIEKDEDKDKQPTTNNDDGMYRGMKSYNNYVEKKDDLSYKGAGVKASAIKITTSNFKTSVRFDYQPDICKDYKETGQCSFGDTCKFLHDRSDYKGGWQIEREYDAEQKQKRKEQEEKERGFKDPEDDDNLPFACLICRKPFDNPVMTKCKHFFCEQCALDHNRKSKKCFICKEPTNGAFSQPKKIIDRLIAKTKMMSEINKEVNE